MALAPLADEGPFFWHGFFYIRTVAYRYSFGLPLLVLSTHHFSTQAVIRLSECGQS
jgi:hypothetical protein